MNLDKWWHIATTKPCRDKVLYLLSEKQGGRASISTDLKNAIRSHYSDLQLIEQDIRDLGYDHAAELLRQKLPISPTAQSGDFGEILATEFFASKTNFEIPIRKLRYKDHRNMPPRGDDILGIDVATNGRIHFLKAEVKSATVLRKRTLKKARKALSKNHGQPDPHSLLFIADRLFETGNTSLARKLRNTVAKVNTPASANETTHGLYALSGNTISDLLSNNLDKAGDKHKHIVVGAQVTDHRQFIAKTYKEA